MCGRLERLPGVWAGRDSEGEDPCMKGRRTCISAKKDVYLSWLEALKMAG
jgi:hypothetical protein